MSDYENLVPIIYEQVLSKKLKKHIDNLLSENNKQVFVNKLDKTKCSSVLFNYKSSMLKTCLDIVAGNVRKKDDGSDDYKIHSQIDFINDILSKIRTPCPDEKNLEEVLFDRNGNLLLSIADNDTFCQNTLKATEAKNLVSPDTLILFSELFIGASSDYQLGNEHQKEIKSADEVCLLVPIIKYTAFIKIREVLKELTEKLSHKLYIITASCICATDIKAIKELSIFKSSQIKISYDTKITKLHAKANIFKRKPGFLTANVGSSNISKDAITTGL